MTKSIAATVAERASLLADVAEARRAEIRSDWIGAKLRQVAKRMESALTEDADCAAAILAGMVGDVSIAQLHVGIYAQLDIGPALPLAVRMHQTGWLTPRESTRVSDT